MTELKTKKDDYQKALAAYSQAMKEFRKGSFDEAAKLFNAVLENFSGEREIADKCRTYLSLVQKSRKKEPVSIKTIDDHLLQASLKMNMGEYPAAVALLEKALQLKEKEGHVYYLLASVHCLMGETDPALDFLKKAIQKDKAFSILARNDPDFESVADDKKFKLIIRLI